MIRAPVRHGGMAERFNAPVLKTGDAQASVGSNPTPSARLAFGNGGVLEEVRKQVQQSKKAFYGGNGETEGGGSGGV